MDDKQVVAPANTAVRTALWRTIHVEVDAPPHVFADEVGLKLAAPESNWRSRPDGLRPPGNSEELLVAST